MHPILAAMKHWLLSLIFVLSFSFCGKGQQRGGHQELRFLKEVFQAGKGLLKKDKAQQVAQWEENPKAVAAALTVLMGPFAAHRIYLGTSPKVPVFYTLTLGGGLGVLPIIDLMLILSAKDLSVYYNKDTIFLWSE